MKLIKYLDIAGEKSKDGESKETTKNEDAKKWMKFKMFRLNCDFVLRDGRSMTR